MLKKNKNSELMWNIFIACLLTALIFVLGHQWGYEGDQNISTEPSDIASQEIVETLPFADSIVTVADSSAYMDGTASAALDLAATKIDDGSQFIGNSLQTGATPYAKYYGGNKKCNKSGCSKIKITTSNSDVVVTLKKDGNVVRHAYIRAGDAYTFSFPNGTYQAFFYYGSGWDPEKEMKGGAIKGGFVSDESFGKDLPQSLNNNILEYSLVLQAHGNFSTSPSDSDEAL